MTTNSPKQLYYLTGTIKHIRRDISHFDDIAYCSESGFRRIYAYICISNACLHVHASMADFHWAIEALYDHCVTTRITALKGRE